MITIHKNGQTAKVPANSYKRMFQPYGWTTSPKKPEKPEDPKPPEVRTAEELDEMSDPELRQYAALVGIKTKTLKTRDEVLKAIKAAQK